MIPFPSLRTEKILHRASVAPRLYPLEKLALHRLNSPARGLPVFIARNTPENRKVLFSTHPPGSTLTPSELQRAHAIPSAELRDQWIFSRLLLKSFLAQILNQGIAEVRLHHSLLGKPHIAHLSFSLSHCQQYTALAFGPPEYSLGVDIEQTCSLATARSVSSFLHPNEQKELAHTHAETLRTQATQLWVRKEAFLKALGTGLLREPSRDFLGPLTAPKVPQTLTGGSLEHLTRPYITDHHIALCALPAVALHGSDLEFKTKDL